MIFGRQAARVKVNRSVFVAALLVAPPAIAEPSSELS
jgi:hypothetical protein